MIGWSRDWLLLLRKWPSLHWLQQLMPLQQLLLQRWPGQHQLLLPLLLPPPLLRWWRLRSATQRMRRLRLLRWLRRG